MKVWFSVCLVIALAFNLATCQVDSAYVYAVSSVDANSEGIVLYHLNLTTGELSKIRGTTGLPYPSYLAIDKKHKYLYSVNEDETGGVVYAYSIDQSTGNLKYLNQQYSNGGPVYVFLDHTNQVLLTANYGAGSVMSFPIDTKTGKIGPVASVNQHHGKSVNPDRQEGPHAHFVMMDPTNVFAMSVDLGTDQVWSCTLNPTNGQIIPAPNPIAYTATPGAGPRHLIFHPNGKFVYIIHELGNIIVAASYDSTSGLFTDLQTISTLPKDFQGESFAAAINILPNGKFLYGSNRGDDSNNIVVFKVDQDTGFLTLIQHISVEGNYPRDFTIDPTGQVLLVGNEKSGNVTTFLINLDTGLLTYSGHSVDLPAPQCLKVIQKFSTQGDLITI